jgi:hypothetical protein
MASRKWAAQFKFSFRMSAHCVARLTFRAPGIFVRKSAYKLS